MRITKISIRNFKAFHGTTEIDVNGNNLLAYGENGSGKSSLAEALRAIFANDDLLWEIVDSSPVNIFLPDGSSAEIEIKLDNSRNDKNSIEFKGRSYNATLSSIVLRAGNINGFLTYKQLLEVYFLPFDKEQLNLYNLLIYNLLFSNINPVTNQSFAHDLSDIKTNILNYQNHFGIKANGKKLGFSDDIINSAKERLITSLLNISEGIKKILDELMLQANKLLEYFNYKIEIEEFIFSGLKHDEMNHCVDKFSERIKLRLKYCGDSIDDYSNILNEARLTALAICIYLASIKIVPEPELKVLILDDIMIGLDMGNRQSIVDILQTKFADWQIFFMTYDRFWFEKLKKHSFTTGWTTAEIYSDNSGRFPKPVIIQPSLSNFEKCQKYYKSHDYPASANYLRKAFEEFLYDF